MTFDSAIFEAKILYIPASVDCTSDIVNEYLSEENTYSLVLLNISTKLSRLEWKYHWTSDVSARGIAVPLKEIVTVSFLVTAMVDCPSLGIIYGETRVKINKQYMMYFWIQQNPQKVGWMMYKDVNWKKLKEIIIYNNCDYAAC